VKKREQTNELRKKAVAAKGLEAVRVNERVKDRSLRIRRTERFEENPELRAAFLKKRNVMDKNWLANGGKPKANGINRKFESDTMYPSFFMTKMSTATQHFVRLCGRKKVPWNRITALFDELLVREQHKEGMDVRFVQGKPRYNHTAYLVAVAPFLTRCEIQRKLWDVINFDNRGDKPFKTYEVVIAEVVSLMYPSA
jgi:hypothetical protein